uniref:NADH-ubiquinone oxidoreductase chain 5 n=1 Tax=Cyanidiococcus yangmingshanensis TaxID=2690220 RepID=A0A7H0WBD3_9RHOD|nr:NADH dehydrogenase subunit 5 [Cyanidiococcus yangmingshanensis]UNJ18947.1 NADH dehydrogenase subunit 5 [Cyanidioschyzonaceae sp. 2 FvB-2021]
MYLIAIFAPLLGFIICGLFGRFLGKKGACFITYFCSSISLVFSIIIFYEVSVAAYDNHILLAKWVESSIFFVSWGFNFDSLTVLILVMVSFISLLVNIYSIEYIEEDPHQVRFISYLNIFVFFMFMLVTANNFIQLFLGWEGVGLSSYLLINFWFTRLIANKAAIKAIIINRVGDFFLSLGIFFIFFKFKSLDYNVVFSITPSIIDNYLECLGVKFLYLDVVTIFLFLGAIGKSAQIGIHMWLPDAIEGPTPVSALIHAATMVTAGVFLIVRCSPIFEFSHFTLVIISVVGALTSLFAGSVAIFQNDLKRVIAYSTCSQLGYIMFACGISNYMASMFHLLNHAFFKALLFLSAGYIIHNLANEQDIRRIGSLIRIMPIAYIAIIIGSLSLMGIPFLTGFYSKDLILELTFGSYFIIHDFTYWLAIISASITAIYSIRLVLLTFIKSTNVIKINLIHIHYSSTWMIIPLVILIIGSVYFGFILKDIIIGLGTDFWGSSILTHYSRANFVEVENLHVIIKWLPLFVSILGVVIILFIYNYDFKIFSTIFFKYTHSFFYFFNKKWYFDKIANIIAIYLLSFGYNVCLKVFDKGIIEYFGPFGLMKIVPYLSTESKSLQTGQIAHYIFVILMGLLFLILSTEFINIFYIINYIKYVSCILFAMLLFFFT